MSILEDLQVIGILVGDDIFDPKPPELLSFPIVRGLDSQQRYLSYLHAKIVF